MTIAFHEQDRLMGDRWLSVDDVPAYTRRTSTSPTLLMDAENGIGYATCYEGLPLWQRNC